MKTISKTAASKISDLSIIDGSKKSLTAKLKTILNADDAKSFSDSVVEAFGKNFKKSDVVKHANNLAGHSPRPEVKAKSTGSGSKPKNVLIREMLAKKMSISDIRKELNLSYQRVKNVKKAMDAKKKK
jgi:hypothetical protein